MYVCLERTTDFPPPLHTPPHDHGLPVPTRDFQVALAWLQRLTSIFQAARRAIFGVRRIELLSLDAQTRHATVVSPPRKRNPFRSLPLYQACRIYLLFQPSAPRRQRSLLHNRLLLHQPCPRSAPAVLCCREGGNMQEDWPLQTSPHGVQANLHHQARYK